MKHYLITILTIFTCNLVSAQKQDNGNYTIEMELAPLGSEPLKINSIRLRKFTSDNTALRLSTFIGGKRTPSINSAGGVDLKSVSSNVDFSIRPGIEKHFDGTSKLSPYIGTELFLGLGSTNQSSESVWGSNQIMTTKTKSRTSSAGLNVVCGADYYFSDKIYLGIEMGYGFLRDGKGSNSTKYTNPSDPSMTDLKTKGNSTNLNWGPNYQGTIRLGFCIK
jgi:hypothetical protein